MLPSLPKLMWHCLHCRGGFFLSGLGLLTGTRLCFPRLEVLGLLLVELDEPGLHDDPLTVLPLPLLELDAVASSLFELDAGFTFNLGC